MKSNILNINGKKIKEINLPKIFSSKIRKDVVQKILEIKKNKQPYSPSPVAGKQHAAKGKVVHRRHVWRSGYGRGASRVPRKIFSRKGSQFNWEAAEVPQARGGMRTHPPKIISFYIKKINKKELKIAFASALSATASKKFIVEKYKTLDQKDIKEVPFVVDSKIISLKTKELVKSLKEILGEKMFKVILQKKKIRAGKGKLRGRKYKKNLGLLIVVGKKEKLKTKIFDIVYAKKMGINDLAKGGLGRIVIYTEEAINDLEEFK
ncbi:MAG: 50S ribosomal protein L4 [Nanoarchaeota archaeon]|nr:50S ribosomal protein L4 [Nanoarchaeota archaeon]MBU1028315.1 50S ribosomal protein L4 [Nanoarchaeota archaeon]